MVELKTVQELNSAHRRRSPDLPPCNGYAFVPSDEFGRPQP